MKDLGAVFGQKFGWERPNFFATDGMKQEDDWSFRRSNWFKAMEKECKNVKENVGLLDMTAFAKCRIKGPKAEEFLDNLVANKLPKKIGRINLCHALNTKGGVHSEFTIMREAEDSFYLVSAGAFQRLDHDWILKWMPNDGSVQFENLTNSTGVLVVSGPKARDLMKKVSSDDFSNDNFKWLSSKKVDIGYAPCTAMRVNFVGELGWELHHPIEYQNHIFDKLMEQGKDLGLKPFGIRAMNSLRNMYFPSSISPESIKELERKDLSGYIEMYLPQNQINIQSPMFCNKYKVEWNSYGIPNENDISDKSCFVNQNATSTTYNEPTNSPGLFNNNRTDVTHHDWLLQNYPIGNSL